MITSQGVVKLFSKGDKVLTPVGHGVVIEDQYWNKEQNNFSHVKMKINTREGRRVVYRANNSIILLNKE